MLLALVFAGCFLTGVFCSMMFFTTLIAGDGVQLWTIQGAFGAGALACIGWIIHQIDTRGWDGWQNMVQRARNEIRIRIMEWRQ